MKTEKVKVLTNKDSFFKKHKEGTYCRSKKQMNPQNENLEIQILGFRYF